MHSIRNRTKGDIVNLTRKTIKLLALTLLTLMILATAPSFVAAQEPEWQAHPMHRVKAGGLDPNSIVDNTAYFTPDEIKVVYNLLTGNDVGSGTIAIIDAYDNPRVTQDLTIFSSTFGLPLPTKNNFEIHKMSPLTQVDAGWALEISLDVQWAHAIAPNAKILLVEARSASLGDLLSAVNYARNQPDVVAISMSWGGSEFLGQTNYNTYFTSRYGASFFASSGDTGGAISWPSSSANVISVGGTTLTQTSTGYEETAWSGSGGGVSAYEPKPKYQTSSDLISYTNRATPDVAYNANPNTGFWVYDSYGYEGYSGWFIVGGTSAGAPQWAAIQAIGKTATNNNFYSIYNSLAYSQDFRDITLGSNGYTTVGYDLVTGIGSPIDTNFAAPDFSLSATPVSFKIGSQGTSIITVNPLNGYTGTVSLTATSPSGITTTISTGSTSTTFTVTIAATRTGTYAITVTGTDQSPYLTPHQTTITVTVTRK